VAVLWSSSVDARPPVELGAVGSEPGADAAVGHRQRPSAFVDQVMMTLAQWEQIVQITGAAVDPESNAQPSTRLVRVIIGST
jgi:hypothetical protein